MRSLRSRMPAGCPLAARWVYIKAPPLFTLGLCLQHRRCNQSPKRRGQSGKGARCAPLGLFIGYGADTIGIRVGSFQGRWRALGKTLKCCPRSLARPRSALYPCAYCISPYAWCIDICEWTACGWLRGAHKRCKGRVFPRPLARPRKDPKVLPKVACAPQASTLPLHLL